MRQIVAEDAPISREPAALADALELFRERGELEKLRLLQRRQSARVTLYNLRGFRDYFHGFMVPSTGYLRHFALHAWPPGIVLQYPRRSRPTELMPISDYPSLTAVFREYGDWLRLLGVESVSGLNEASETSRLREVILVSEALHEQGIAHIADQIASRRDKARLVLVIAVKCAVAVVGAGVRDRIAHAQPMLDARVVQWQLLTLDVEREPLRPAANPLGQKRRPLFRQGPGGIEDAPLRVAFLRRELSLEVEGAEQFPARFQVSRFGRDRAPVGADRPADRLRGGAAIASTLCSPEKGVVAARDPVRWRGPRRGGEGQDETEGRDCDSGGPARCT